MLLLHQQDPAPVADGSWRDWIYAVASLAGALLLAVVAHWLLLRLLKPIVRHSQWVDETLLQRLRRPLLLVFCVLAVRLVLPALHVPPGVEAPLAQALSIAVIVTIAWVITAGLTTAEYLIARRHDMTARDNLQARRVNTQVRILRRSLSVIVFVIALGAVLMTFPRVQQFGTSILASAGLAGLIVGLAARPTVENLITGFQLAFTEPFRLDDVVIIAGEWGRIEEINATYVVVRIWDERRLVVPFSKFLQEPFQNWTRTNAQILGTVFVHADYRVPVEAVRAELQRIVEGCELWDRRVCVLQVTDATPQTVQLRALVSAADAGKSFDLRCYVRERLLQFLQREHPDSLPRVRAELIERTPAGSGVQPTG